MNIQYKFDVNNILHYVQSRDWTYDDNDKEIQQLKLIIKRNLKKSKKCHRGIRRSSQVIMNLDKLLIRNLKVLKKYQKHQNNIDLIISASQKIEQLT